jgi:uncharacterized membrane protein
MKFISKWIENLSSKKFWVAIIALVTYLSDKDPSISWPIAIITAIYLACQSYVDAVKAKNGAS